MTDHAPFAPRPRRPLLVPNLSLGAPIRVLTLVAPGGEQCSHLIACEQTWTAAIIDPVSEIAPALARILEQRSLRLRLVLRTRPTGQATAADQRYHSLMSELGMTAANQSVSGGEALPWQGLPQAGPVLEQDPDEDGLLVQAGDTEVVIVSAGPSGPPVTVGGCGGRPPQGARVRSLRAALGAYHIHALPLGTRATVAWMVADRLFTGTHLRGNAAAGTPGDFLALPPETLVYPSHLTDGRSISTIGQERSHAERHRPSASLGARQARKLRLHCGA